MTVTPTMSLLRPDGEVVELGEALTADLTAVQLVRYFGCLPCQEWLVDLDRAADRLACIGVVRRPADRGLSPARRGTDRGDVPHVTAICDVVSR